VLDLASAARAIGARHIGANIEFDRVTTDSRDLRVGDLFVGIHGERFDGQAFADQALVAGAAAVMVGAGAKVLTPNARVLEVDDTRLALGRLAAFWRGRFSVPLVGITGSNGKTTVKEMLASILRQVAGESGVLATAGNLNNDIGMPLTLLRLNAAHRYAVIEMGMNHLGEISYLSALAKPTVALINNAGTAHIGELGSADAIARALESSPNQESSGFAPGLIKRLSALAAQSRNQGTIAAPRRRYSKDSTSRALRSSTVMMRSPTTGVVCYVAAAWWISALT